MEAILSTNGEATKKRSLAVLLRRTKRYVSWKRAVWKRDCFTCQRCGLGKWSGTAVEAHHLTSFSELIRRSGITTVEEGLFTPSLWRVNNGQTLCRDCHLLAHAPIPYAQQLAEAISQYEANN